MNWATAFFAGDEHPDHHKPLDGLRGLAVLMVVFGHGANHGLGPFALAATFGPGWWASLLSFKPLRWVGKVSFSMYLFHIPVLMCVKILGWNPAVLWIVYLSATVVVCAVTYLCVEYPLQSFKPFPYGSTRAK